MGNNERPVLTKTQQDAYIDALAAELVPLRAKVGLSQGEIASLIGVSRQTYSSIETRSRRMTWNTYLSLLFSLTSMPPRTG